MLLSSFVVARTASEPATPASDFSKEAVVVEQSLSRVVVQDDGSYTEDHQVRARVQSAAGVQQYGILPFPYRASVEHVDILSVRVLKPNGSVITTALDSVQDVTSEIYRQAPIYTDLREKHVPVKGLEPGDILEYSTRLQVDKPLIPGQFWLGLNFIKNAVSLDEQIEISLPAGREVKIKSPALQPLIRVEKDRRVYSWKRANLESKSPEKLKKEQSYEMTRGLLPSGDVLISTFRSWEEVGDWYNSLQLERVQPTPEVKAKAEELTRGLDNDDAKLRAIYNYVSLHYRYVGISFGIGGYQPHTAGEILGNQYGDCKDKHTLLAAMLKAAGFSAYPALISSSTAMDPDVPSPGQFDHVITVVARGSTLLWMDSTPEVTPMGYLRLPLRGKPALVVMPGNSGLQTTPDGSSFINGGKYSVVGKLAADGSFEAHSETVFLGDDELYFRYILRRIPEVQWRDYAQKVFYGGRIGGTVSSVKASQPDKTDEPFTLSYDYTVKDFFSGANHRFIVPLSPAGLPAVQDDDLSRTKPLWLMPLGEYLLESRIELPKGWSAVQLMPLNLTESYAEFHASTDFHDGVLVTKRRLLVKASEIKPDQLRNYKEFQKAISDNQQTYIYLRTPDATASASGSVAYAYPSRYLPVVADAWTDSEKSHYAECISKLKKDESDLQRRSDAYACSILQEEEHWKNLHPEASAKKEDMGKFTKCLKEHRAQLVGTAEQFHETYDVCLREAYGLPKPKH